MNLEPEINARIRNLLGMHTETDEQVAAVFNRYFYLELGHPKIERVSEPSSADAVALRWSLGYRIRQKGDAA